MFGFKFQMFVPPSFTKPAEPETVVVEMAIFRAAQSYQVRARRDAIGERQCAAVGVDARGGGVQLSDRQKALLPLRSRNPPVLLVPVLLSVSAVTAGTLMPPCNSNSAPLATATMLVLKA